MKFLILLKRNIMQPLLWVLLSAVISLSVIYCNIPEEDKSTNINICILNLDSNADSVLLANELISSNSVFHFYEVSSENEMYDALVDGSADIGYIIPSGFMESSGDISTLKKVDVYTTNKSAFVSASKEVFFSRFFTYATPYIIEYKIKNFPEYSDVNPVELDNAIRETFYSYQNGDNIFTIKDAFSDSVIDLSIKRKFNLPLKKLCYFFILTCSLFAVAICLKDREGGIIYRLTKREVCLYNLMQIAAMTLPISIISFMALMISGACSFKETAIEFIIYVMCSILLSFAVSVAASFAIKKSTSYYKMLPFYLILNLIFGGVFLDLSSISPIIKVISMFFLPSYF